jgi:methyl-accepting chemotaxis protein
VNLKTKVFLLIGSLFLILVGIQSLAGVTFASTLICLFLLLIVLHFVMQKFMHRISRILHVLEKTCEGDTSTRVDDQQSDELGRISDTLDKLVAEKAGAMQKRMDVLKTKTAEADRIKQALDNAFACFMIVDTDYNITYVNEALEDVFQNNEDEMLEMIEDFDVSNLISKSYGMFYIDPAAQFEKLKDIQDVYIESLEISDCTYRTVISPTFDENNQRTAMVIEWLDITGDLIREQHDKARIAKERAIAQENARVRAGLDTVQASVMLVNENADIIYMNEMATTLFEIIQPYIEKELAGFDASKLMSSNIDIFYQNKAGTRLDLEELDDSDSIRLALADRTLTMTATPVLVSGKKLGTVIEWVDISAELAADKQKQQKLERERALAEENKRIKQSLDTVTGNVLITGKNYNIRYMNDAIMQMFSSAESDIQSVIEGFNVQHLIGGSIGVLQPDPDNFRDHFEALTEAYEETRRIAGHDFVIITSPVFAEGDRIGTVFEWIERTEEIAVEEEINEIVIGAKMGDLGQRIHLENKTGFFKVLGAGINDFLTTVSDLFDDIGRIVDAQNEGDLSQHIEKEYFGQFQEITYNMNAATEQLSGIISNIRQASSQIEISSKEISQGNITLSQRTEQEAANLDKAKNKLNQLTEMVNQTASDAKVADQLSGQAKLVAVKSAKVVNNAVTAMDEISDSSRQIANIINVIDEISFQTNLLALNASVEAARAGEGGRGFSVVATEVRNLSQRSAESAQEIKTLVTTSLERVEAGTRLVNAAGASLNEIMRSVEKVVQIISGIDSASQEEASSIEQLNETVASIDKITQQNASLAEQTAAASESSFNHAEEMSKLISFFK